MSTVYKTWNYKKKFYFNDYFKQVSHVVENNELVELHKTSVKNEHNLGERIMIGEHIFVVLEKIQDVLTLDTVYIVERDNREEDNEKIDYESMAEAYKEEAEYYKTMFNNKPAKKKLWFS